MKQAILFGTMFSILTMQGCGSADKREDGEKARVQTFTEQTGMPREAAVAETPNLFASMQHLPVELMEEAMANFKSQNFTAASSALKNAGEILKTEAKAMRDPAAARELNTAGVAINRLSVQVSNRKLESIGQLRSALITALYHDANGHRLEAANAWTKSLSKQTGFQLEAATDALSRSQGLADRKGVWLKTDVKPARATATELMKGSGIAKPNTVLESLNLVAAGVEELRSSL